MSADVWLRCDRASRTAAGGPFSRPPHDGDGAYGGAVLLLVRHAMPAADPNVAPEEWHLDPSGRSAAAALASMLPDHAVLVASTESKARETLDPAGAVAT